MMIRVHCIGAEWIVVFDTQLTKDSLMAFHGVTGEDGSSFQILRTRKGIKAIVVTSPVDGNGDTLTVQLTPQKGFVWNDDEFK